jgi:hypothetical protein
MIRSPSPRLRAARPRPRGWLPVGAAVAAVAASAIVLGGVLFGYLAPRAVVGVFHRALADDPHWRGHIDDLQLDLWRATGVVRGLSIRAASDQKVLRTVDIPLGHLQWSWRSVLRGELHVDLVAISPTVGARARRERLSPPDPPPPDPGWFRFEVDAAIVDGTWIWRDLERDPVVHLELHPVNGAYEHIGTVDGPGRLDLVAAAPDSGLVAVDARLDFWNADRDAFDIDIQLQDLRPAALQGADEAYAGIRLAEGRFDGSFAATWDAGRQELEGPPYAVGTLDDLRLGRIRVRLEGRGLALADPPVARVALRDLRLSADGPVVGDEPFVASALGEGLEVHVRRSDLAILADLPATGRATLDRTLRRLPPFRLPLVRLADAELRFTDDGVSPPADLGAHGLQIDVRGFDNVSAVDAPAEVTVRGGLFGGTLDVRGAVEPLVWPPRLDVEADLRDVSLTLPAVAQALRSYTGVEVERGTVSARATARSDGDGARIVGDVGVSGHELVAVSNGWRVGVQDTQLALVEGRGHASGVRADPLRESSVRRIRAAEVDVDWDMARLVDRGELVASVHARQPLVVARRPPPGGRMPRRGPGRWSVDLYAEDGRLVWQDLDTTPRIGLVMDPFDARVLRLGTLHDQARWEVAGGLSRGGFLWGWSEVDAFGGPGSPGPMRMEVRATCLPLGSLRDVTEAYLGVQLEGGSADAVLSVEDGRGHLQVDGTGLSLADPPVEDVAAERFRASLRWRDDVGPSSRVLTGAAEGVTVTVDGLPAFEGPGDPIRELLRDLPPLRVPRFDVTGGRLVVRAPVDGADKDLELDDVRVAVRALRTGADRDGQGIVQAAAALDGGEVRLEARAPRHGPATVWLDAEQVLLPALDPWTRAATGLDTAAGQISVTGRVALADDGGIDGQIDLGLTGVDVLQADDLREGLGVWLKSAAAGVVVDLLERDGTARLSLPVAGTATAPDVRTGRAVLRALLSRVGLARRAPEIRPPLPLPPPTAPVELELDIVDPVCALPPLASGPALEVR